jgi:hypothetical protein
MSITAAVCDIARLYSQGTLKRQDLTKIHDQLKEYYLSMYRILVAIEECVGSDGEACGDINALMACVEDLCARRQALARVLQVVWGGVPRG